MKLLKLTAILTFFLHVLATTKVEAQCYPVFKPMAKQAPAAPKDYRNGMNGLSSFTNSSISLSVSLARFNSTFNHFDTIVIRLWDDTGWMKLNPFIMRNNPIYSIYKIDGKIYLSGEFDQFDYKNAPYDRYFTLLEYKNGVWDSVPGCLSYNGVPDADNFQYYAVTSSGLYKIKHSFKANFNKGIIELLNPSTGAFVKVCTFNCPSNNLKIAGGRDRLLIGGVDSIDNTYTDGFVYIDSTTISTNNDTTFDTNFDYHIDPVDDHIYAIHPNNPEIIYEYHNQLLNKRTTSPYSYKFSPITGIYDGKILRILSSQNLQTATPFVLCRNETEWAAASEISNYIYIIYNKNGFFKYDLLKETIYKLDENGSAISGRAYIDLDSNCVYDSLTDYIVKAQLIKAKGPNNLTYSARTDKDGKYSIFVTPDIYKISGPFSRNSCGSDTLHIDSTGTSSNKDMPLLQSGIYDLNVKLINGNRARWNSYNTITGMFENKGDKYDSAYFEFTIDGRLDSISSSDTNITSINGNIVKGKFKNLDYFDTRYVTIYAWVDTATTKPDTVLCSWVSGWLYTSETDSSNNADTVCQKVVYSYDPNYKSCDNEIIPPAKTSKLEYTIEFQNEGNDDAYDVVITDQLSTLLNLESLEIIGASHPYNYTLKNGLLTITFKNIFLKPKMSNEALSKGYFKYSIVTKSGLQNQSRINNTAYIYFDLNKPVITNTSVVLVSDGNNSSVQGTKLKNATITAYPNPAKGELHISSTAGNEVFIYNMEGRPLATITLQNGVGVADMSQWATGIYLVRCGNAWLKIVKEE